MARKKTEESNDVDYEKKHTDDMKEVEYKCAQCGATDRGRFFLSEVPMSVINCWKCHAGMKMPVNDMLARRVGMFPVAVN